MIVPTFCPESFHRLPRVVCLAPNPGSAAAHRLIQPVSVPYASGMIPIRQMTGPLEMLACLNITPLSQIVLQAHTACFDNAVGSLQTPKMLCSRV